MLRFYVVGLLLVVGAVTTLAVALGSPGWWVLAGLVPVVLALAVHDLLQRRHSILRNYPVLGRVRFLMESIRPELQQYFIRDRVRIGAGGKVTSGIDVVKRLVQGADDTSSARAMMMAVGCIQAQTCHTNTCPVGVATQDPKRMRALDVPDKTARVHHYQEQCVQQAMQVMGSMGVHGPDGLGPHMLRRRVEPRRGPLVRRDLPPPRARTAARRPLDGAWARDWALADPDRFSV